MKLLLSIATASLLAVSVTASLSALAPARASQAATDELPDAPGKAVVNKVCTACHGTALLSGARLNAEDWVTTIRLMKDLGAEATEEEWKTVTDYIVVNLAQLEVNRAPAKDFVAILRVSDKVAEEVVAYRQKQGPFKTVDDLKRAPGLDPATIDAIASRIAFD